MPPVKKFKKEDILEVAKDLVKKEGFASINARSLARKLGSSVNPIFNNFGSMDELTKELYRAIYEIFKEYMAIDIDEEGSYKKMGLAYIRFASEYPEFFKALFMQKTALKAKDFLRDGVGENVVKAGTRVTHLSMEEQREFHVKVWIFTHGLATLVATGTINLSDEEIGRLLESAVQEMFRGRTRGEK